MLRQYEDFEFLLHHLTTNYDVTALVVSVFKTLHMVFCSFVSKKLIPLKVTVMNTQSSRFAPGLSWRLQVNELNLFSYFLNNKLMFLDFFLVYFLLTPKNYLRLLQFLFLPLQTNSARCLLLIFGKYLLHGCRFISGYF